jgi:hypothetical protein
MPVDHKTLNYRYPSLPPTTVPHAVQETHFTCTLSICCIKLFPHALILMLCKLYIVVFYFAFWTMHFLKVNEKPTNALIIQCIGTQYSPTCFGTLKCHHHGIKLDSAETGAQPRGKQRMMGAVYLYCNRQRDGRDITA